MYGTPYMNMPPPWMWPQGPSSSAPPPSPVQQITDWIRGLEELKKSMKEEKKDDPKKKTGPDISVFSMMLFMVLISPITGPAMYHFFQLSLGLVK